MHADEMALWQAWKHDPSPANTDALVRHYEKRVRQAAYNFHQKLPHYVELDDLVQESLVGMIECFATFDAERNNSFWTFAYYRIAGAMRDFLRSVDWVPRLERKRQKEDGRRLVGMESLERVVFEKDDGTDLEAKDFLGNDDRELRSFEQEEAVRHLLRGVPRRQRLMLLWYFCDDVTMKEIAERLGLSESRVSQAVAAVLEDLRKRNKEVA